jgi:citrate lyase subunit beta/citryl-CoA lyase
MNFPRSLLFVPANRTEMFARAWESEAEAVVFDLEDSVLPAQKGAARDALVTLSPPKGWTRPIFVRVNALGTDNFDLDLRAMASTAISLAGVVLPKVERADQVRAAQKAQPLALVLLIETPGGVMRAAGVPAIDAPLLTLDDPDRLRAAARRAKALGFQAMFAVHPAQIPVIHEGFAGGADRAWALRAVDAYERAARDGHGSVALDGRVIDEATMKRARDILK